MNKRDNQVHANVATHVFTARIPYVPREDLSKVRRVLLGLGLLLNNCALVFMIQSAGIV